MGDGYWRPGNVHPFPSSGRFGSPQWNDRKKSKKQENREDRKRKSKSSGYQAVSKSQKKKGNSLGGGRAWNRGKPV